MNMDNYNNRIIAYYYSICITIGCAPITNNILVIQNKHCSLHQFPKLSILLFNFPYGVFYSLYARYIQANTYIQGRLKHTMGPGQKKHMGPIIICITY